MKAFKTDLEFVKIVCIVFFITPFIFSYWHDSLIIDLYSFVLFNITCKQIYQPTARRMTIIQLSLYIYFVAYLIACVNIVTHDDIPLLIKIIGCFTYAAVSIIALISGKKLSDYIANVPLDINPKVLTSNHTGADPAGSSP